MDDITKIKAELFDLHVQHATIKTQMQEKLKKLNELISRQGLEGNNGKKFTTREAPRVGGV